MRVTSDEKKVKVQCEGDSSEGRSGGFIRVIVG